MPYKILPIILMRIDYGIGSMYRQENIPCIDTIWSTREKARVKLKTGSGSTGRTAKI